MALLDADNKKQAVTKWTEELMQAHEGCSVIKSDVMAALEALDAFLDANAAALNQAIPLPARADLTVKQKARLLSWVIRQRYLVT